MTSAPRRTKSDDIAIVGMAGRFPGAPDIETFWTNIRDGVESIRKLTEEELLNAGATRAELSDPDYVRASPVLEDADKFDAAFFGFSPRDAAVMDPAHRIFLELAWKAVEHAGYTALPDEGPIGVFAGAGAPLYMIENLRTNPDLMRSMGEFLVRHTGNDMNFLATRVSYEMDLRGPSMNIQTACSSALVSLHVACQSLLHGDCAMALAGGATLLVPQGRGYVFKEGEILSPDGHCRPFDAKSAGTVFGSGAGVVVLKRLSDALDAGDTIHAVIKGSAINNDGAVKVGYLAPGVDGQAAVIQAALDAAGVAADSISYVETHGTGTLVGDPIEVEALNEAFRTRTSRRAYCAIGSVKSNIGHLGEAAAVASLIKAVMALKHRQLPPSLGYETPNPAIDFDDSPFFVNSSLRDWQAKGPLRCGVTALGAGGTNCHVILEEAPTAIPGEGARDQQLILLSAKTMTALDQASDNLATALESNPSLDLADAAYTLALGRRSMPHRRALAVRNRDEAAIQLRRRDTKQVVTDQAQGSRPRIIFMFPGGGAQYAGMGAELYAREDVYRDAIDACLKFINPAVGFDLKSLMFPELSEVERATRKLEQPSLTLPSLFATEYALARLFESWGLKPEAMIGHSMGEYVAACISGVLSLEDALRLVMLRGRLFEAVERGAMLSVPLSENELLALAPKSVSIAAANAQDLCVASGPVAAITALQEILAARDIESTLVRIDVAAHSAMLDPILGKFRDLCRSIRFQPPTIPYVSNVTGTWVTPAQVMDPGYWVSHLRSTVRFADGLTTIRALGETALLEVGPGRTLCMLARAQAVPFRRAFNCMRHPQESGSDLAYALTSLGRLWAAGSEIDLTALYNGQLRNRIPLPTYPFERKSYWVEPGKAALQTSSEELTKRASLDDWFYDLSFAAAPLVQGARSKATRRWLVISESVGAAKLLSGALAPDTVVVASAGRAASFTGDLAWRLDFDQPEHFASLLEAFEKKYGAPDHVVFLAQPAERRGNGVARNFLHPTFLVQAMGSLAGKAQLSIVTSGISAIEGARPDPRSAMALGPVAVAPREIDRLHARCIDIPSSMSGQKQSRVWSRVVEELRAEAGERLVVLRSGGRWVQRASPMPLAATGEEADPREWLRENGVYLITGGLGGIGLQIAAHLARSKRVKLALMGREALPEESSWDEILAAGAINRTAQRIAQVRSLRALGAEVLVVGGDIASPDSLEAALVKVRAAFGPLNGVIHAAGVMDDAPLMAKTSDAMRRVLAPKVDGALALDSLVREPLDFFVLFSSVASYLGLPGQVDYTAANAFLDAFALARSDRAAGRTVVINWNAWRDIGMAATAHRDQTDGAIPTSPSSHPALDGYSDVAGERVFSTTFSVDKHWLLSEHVPKTGSPLLPGTAFVELARAAFAEGRPRGPIELSNVSFGSPFQVDKGEARRLNIHVAPSAGGYEIAMRAGDSADTPIVVAEARALASPPPAALDIAAIAVRCNVSESTPADRLLPQSFMNFGPRWANIRKTRFGRVEALLELSLDDRFAEDQKGFRLHPAVLDMSTGGAQALIPNADLERDFYVPLGYDTVRIYGDMPQDVVSHVRYRNDSGQGLALFDVTLADRDGNIFTEITGFTMKLLDSRSNIATSATSRGGRRNEALAALLREAITPAEGVAAFDRIMAQPRIVQVMSSSVDVPLWSRKLEAANDVDPVTTDSKGFERPDLAADYAPPTSPVELVLANIWSELLGVRQVGLRDDFFELGGNSLVAVRMFAAVKKQLQVSLPLATLFEAPTIADLSAVLLSRGVGATAGAEVAAEEPAWSPLVKIRAGSVGRKPVFCVHGGKGNVMIFKPLADRLGAHRPFYGVQAQGIDGKLAPAETIEEMASSYLAAIRAVQPTGPYLLAGYSGGGVIAFEMAHQLKRAGERADVVAMIDTLEPDEMKQPITSLDRIRQLPNLQIRHFLNYPRVLYDRLMYRLNGPEVVATALESAALDVEAAYRRAQSKYNPATYAGDIVLIRASSARMHFLRAGPTLGWRKRVTGLITVIAIPANHETVCLEPAVDQVGIALTSILDTFDPHDGVVVAKERTSLNVSRPLEQRPFSQVHKTVARLR